LGFQKEIIAVGPVKTRIVTTASYIYRACERSGKRSGQGRKSGGAEPSRAWSGYGNKKLI